MKVIKVKNYEEMSNVAAEIFKDVVKNKPNAVLGLATGTTPLGLYAELIKDHKENGTSYKNIKTVNLDEYAGLDIGSDQSYVYFMRHNLFEGLDIDLKNTNIENGKAEDKEKECERYNNLLGEMQQDIQLLGLGSNGHIAFNDPHVADFHDEKAVKPVKLDEVCRMQQVNDGCFQAIEEVPQYALTLTIPTLIRAPHLFWLSPKARWCPCLSCALFRGG